MSTPGLEIRPLRAADEADWRRLWRAYLEFYETELPEAVYASTFARLIGDDPQDYNCLLAVLEGKPVGLAHFLLHRTCWNVADTCYLQDLYAAPEARGKGIGRALMEAVFARAKEMGAFEVHWLTNTENATARRLYDQLGETVPYVKYRRRL